MCETDLQVLAREQRIVHPLCTGQVVDDARCRVERDVARDAFDGILLDGKGRDDAVVNAQRGRQQGELSHVSQFMALSESETTNTKVPARVCDVEREGHVAVTMC